MEENIADKMNQNKKSINRRDLLHIFVVGLLLLLLIIFTFCDLQISEKAFNKQSFFGRLFREIGEIPMFLIIPFFICSAVFVNKNNAVKIIFIGILPFSNYFWLSKFFGLFKFSSDIMYFVTMLLCAVCFSAFLLCLFKPLQHEVKQKLFRVFLVGIVFALLTLISIQTLKILWGRVRFVNLDNNFSRWYVINGNNGNKSFPSGHTGAACGMFILLTLCKEFRLKPGLKIFLIGIMIAYILSTAVSRIIMGAHFASDVTFAILLCYLLFLLSNYFVYKVRNRLSK